MGLANRDRRTALRRLGAGSSLALLRPAAFAAGWVTAVTARAQLAPDVWDEFRRRFVTNDGRVLDDDGATHSEGLGTALLACAAAGDQSRFERTWSVARALRRDDGLFSWRVQNGGRLVDANNATDGDLYIAWALARAAQAFSAPSYAEEARQTARAIRAWCVRETRFGSVLVPGRFGFDRARQVVANPSYWVFPAFDALRAVDPHPQWAALTDTALTLLARTRYGRRELTADWIEIEGASTRPWRERPARFGYEAIRVPLFLYWAQRFGHPQLDAFVRYAAAPAFPAWVALDDDEASRERAPAGFEAIARLARALPAVTRTQLPGINSSYYSSSLVLLAALANDDVIRQSSAQQNAARAEKRPLQRRVVADEGVPRIGP